MKKSSTPTSTVLSSDQRKEHSHIISRKLYSVRFDKKAIIATANDHKFWEHHRVQLRDLPKYDDCIPYGCSEKNYSSFLEKEVDKLILFAEQDEPPVFDSKGYLKGVSCEDFEHISCLADQMLCILSLLKQDNARHGVEFGTEAADDAWESLIVSRNRLRSRYVKDDTHVKGREPGRLKDKNDEAFHLLLDYIFSVVAWWTVRCADSEYWRTQTLSVLAQWAVKMKVVLVNPAQCVEQSLSETFITIERLKIQAESDIIQIRIGRDKKDVDLAHSQTDFCNLYCEEKIAIRFHLEKILDDLFASLVKHEMSSIGADFFKVCALVYRSDMKCERTCKMYTSHRHGDIATSSTLYHIGFSCELAKLIQHNITMIKRPPQKPHTTEFVKLLGAVRESTVTDVHLKVYEMDHAVTLLVPLLLLNPESCEQILRLRIKANIWTRKDEVIRQFEPPQRDFALEYTLSTSSWLSRLQNPQQDGCIDKDVMTLSNSPLRRGVKGAYELFDPDGYAAKFILGNAFAGHSSSEKLANIRDKYDTLFSEIPAWEIRTSEIIVMSKTYVRIVQVLAIMLVLGGLSVPFSIGERITGVDPFQIATYTWLLAGFFLIAAKSMYIDDWPWNDFLHGRVECHSVSELSEISGIDSQLIVLYLLRREWNTRLVTDGPYNSMFHRTMEPKKKRKKKTKIDESNKDEAVRIHRKGFSIDIPLNVDTMLAGGIIPIKVQDGSGDILICLDGRKGFIDIAVPNTGGNWLTCRNFNRYSLENIFDSEVKERNDQVHTLERIKLRWRKVLGVYVKDEKFG
jgi:hypothetical protein